MRPSRHNFSELGIRSCATFTGYCNCLTVIWRLRSPFCVSPRSLKGIPPIKQMEILYWPIFVYFLKGRGKKQGGCATFKFIIGKITAGSALLFKDTASGMCFPLYFSIFYCCLQIKWKEEWRKSYERCSFPMQTRARKGDFSEKHLHWLVGVLWFTLIRLPQVPKVRCTDCTWGSAWLIKTNAKSRYASESSFHSSLAIWPQVADNTDIDGLIPWSAFEAKSVSKQPADTPFWIRSRADLRIPIRASAMGAKTTARGRQTIDRQVGRQSERKEMEHSWHICKNEK